MPNYHKHLRSTLRPADWHPKGRRGPTVPLYSPTGVTSDAQGNVYIVERGGARVRKLSNGMVASFAGNGVSGFRGGGSAPATEEPLYQPTSMAVGPDGNFYITDSQSLLQVNAAGLLSTTASFSSLSKGNCATGDRPLHFPRRIAFAGDGGIYLSSYVEDRVCKLLPDGSLVAVAGTGEEGYSGDDGAAVSREARQPGRRGGGQQREPLYRRRRQRPHTDGESGRHDPHGGGRRKPLRWRMARKRRRCGSVRPTG